MQPIVVGFLGALLPLIFHTAQNLEYEYASLAGWILGIFCLFCSGKSYLKSALTIIFSALLVNTIAMIVTPKLCNASGTLAWFFIQCVPAVFLGLSFKEKFQKKKFRWLFILVIIGTVSSLLFLWISPQKRWVSLLFGYLHGPIYDDFVPLTIGIIIARISHLFFAWYVHYRSHLLLLIYLILFGVSMTDPINQHGIAALNRALPVTLETSKVRLHFSESQKEQLDNLFLEANFHVKDLTQILGIKLQKPIEIYVYDDTESKKILFGGSETDITDVVTPSVHIVADRSPHPTLRHELVHALLSQNNNLGFHFNMAITEGIAMALAPTDNILSMDQRSRYLLEEGKLPSGLDIFGPFFFLQASQVTYGVSGSFISWLLTIKPPQTFLDVYAGQTFSEAYGEDLTVLYGKWQEYLKSVPFNKDQMNSIANRLLSAPSVFADTCPHSRFDFAKAKKSLLRGKTADSSFYWSWLEKINPEDDELQDHRRNLDRLGIAAEKQVLTATAPSELKSSSRATEAETKTLEIKTLQDFENSLLKADLLQLENQHLQALTLLSKLQSLTMNPGRSLKRGIELRLWILREADEDEKMETYKFFLGKIAQPAFKNIAIEYLARRQKYFKNTADSEFLNEFPILYEELNREIKIMNYRIALNSNKNDMSLGFLNSLIRTEPNNAFWLVERDRAEYKRVD